MDVANHSVVLLQQLNVQREFGFLCDCTVAVGDIHFKAHRAVLAAFSNYFKMIFIHQSSDYIKVQPVDIQPDIFSYLLHLMYTGKGPKQPVDPSRLEEGIRFLHAYNLVHDPGHGGPLFGPHHEVLPLQSPNLYGIQISGSQKVQVAQSAGRSGPPGLGLDQPGQLPSGPVANIPEHRYARPPITQEVATLGEDSSPGATAAAARGLQVPGLGFKRGKSHKHYSCHYCGERFAARGSLRDHLYSHASGTLPSATPPAAAQTRGLGDHPQEAEKAEGLLGEEVQLPAANQHETNNLDEHPPVGLTVTVGAYGGDAIESGSFGTAKRRKFACSVCGHAAEPEPEAGALSPPPAPAATAGPEELPSRRQQQLAAAELEAAFRTVFANYESARVHAHYKCARGGCTLPATGSAVTVTAPGRRGGGDRFVHRWLWERELTYCERTGVYWLLYEEGRGMYCYLCRRHDAHNRQNKSKVFNGTPAVRYKKAALQAHAESQQHGAAVRAELSGRLSARQLARSGQQEAASLRALFQAAYWLAREGLPTAKLRPALLLLGATPTHFRRAATLCRVFRALGCAVRRRVLLGLRRAAHFGLLCERSDPEAGAGVDSALLGFVQYVDPDSKEVTWSLLFAEVGRTSAWDSGEEVAGAVGRALGRAELEGSRLAWLVAEQAGEEEPAARLQEGWPGLLGMAWPGRRLLLAGTGRGGAGACGPLLRLQAWLYQLWELLERSPALAEAYLAARMPGAEAEVSPPSRLLRPALLRRLRRTCRRCRQSVEASVEGAYEDLPALLRALRAQGGVEAAACGLWAQLSSPRAAGGLYILREVAAALLGLTRALRRARGLQAPPDAELRIALQRLREAAESGAPLSRLRADLEPGGRLSACGLPPLDARDQAELRSLLEAYTAGLAAELRRRFLGPEAGASPLAALAIFNPLLVPEPGSPEAAAAHGQAQVAALASRFHPGEAGAEARLQAEWARLQPELRAWRSSLPASALAEPGATAVEWSLRRLLRLRSYPGLAAVAEAALAAPVGPAWDERAAGALRRVEARLRGGSCRDAGLLDSLLHISVNGPELGTTECSQLLEEAAHTFLQQWRPGARASPEHKPHLASVKAEEVAESSEQELEQEQTGGALQHQADIDSDSENSLCD
ncbi:uncharacterized protein LOC116977149 [Amblyraja radiata]|uniref:uncharacterized protein LOC116977149 n=1 Tax=Amblyraja radiata TaxID=386614 RepID=UPI001403FF34|nr:uncharacterized protein LOC116977149 [Amblyraja radiata]